MNPRETSLPATATATSLSAPVSNPSSDTNSKMGRVEHFVADLHLILILHLEVDSTSKLYFRQSWARFALFETAKYCRNLYLGTLAEIN